MFEIEADKTINITRGDSASFVVPIEYAFQSGDVLRFKVFRKKACEDVVLQKDFVIEEVTESVSIVLTEQDTRIGKVISKPVDYWYEIELNPENNPQTLIGYDGDGAKIFRLYPEGRDIEDDELPEGEVDVLRNILTEFKEEVLNNVSAGGNVEIPENVETTDNKVTTIDENSTDEQYASAKATYDLFLKANGSGDNEQDSLVGLEDLRNDRLLVWHDEFNGNALDTEKWSNVYGSTNRGGYFYTEDIKKNTAVNGKLDYYALKDNRYDNLPYSCTYLHTNNKFEFRYGLIEAKIKFSPESVYHSTLWTLGANQERICKGETELYDETKGMNFPSCGEIDIAECDNGNVTAVCHASTEKDGTNTKSGTMYQMTQAGSEWHIYGCEWTDTTISFYVDRVLKGSWNISNATSSDGYNPFMLPHYLILNSIPYLNGTPTWDEMHTLIDWVRVYAPKGVTKKVEETAIMFNSSNVGVAVGGKAFLEATFIPENTSDMTIVWESMNPNICTCYGGKIIGVSSGTTFVKATSKNGNYALCKVTVSENGSGSDEGGDEGDGEDIDTSVRYTQGYISSTGELVSVDNTLYYSSTHFVEVNPSDTVLISLPLQYSSWKLMICEYDENKTFIARHSSKEYAPDSGNFIRAYSCVVSENAHFIKYSVLVRDRNMDMLNAIFDSTYSVVGVNNNILTYEIGSVSYEDGSWDSTNKTRISTDYVLTGTSCSISDGYGFVWRTFDANKNFVASSGGGWLNEISLTTNTPYARFVVRKDENDSEWTGNELDGVTITVDEATYVLQQKNNYS